MTFLPLGRRIESIDQGGLINALVNSGTRLEDVNMLPSVGIPEELDTGAKTALFVQMHNRLSFH